MPGPDRCEYPRWPQPGNFGFFTPTFRPHPTHTNTVAHFQQHHRPLTHPLAHCHIDSTMGISMNASLEITSTPARLLGLECFKADNLWTPPGNRGVFGGQVIAQALMAAIKTVDGLDLHSTHAYFLLPCDSRQSVTYAVERLREGKSYSTRLVHAIQNSETIFTLTASFSRPPDPAGGRRWQRDFPEGVRSYEEAYADRWADYISNKNDFGIK